MKFKSHGMVATAVALGSVLALSTAAMAAEPGQMVSRGNGNNSGPQISFSAQNCGASQQRGSQSSNSNAQQRAGSDFSQGKTSNDENPQNMGGEKADNIESSVSTAIASLNDEDAATLSTYITAYETAVDAEKAAASSDTEDLSSYHTAVKEAVEALLTAAKEADIKLGLTLNSEQKSSDTNSENKKQNGTFPEQGTEQKAKSINSAIASLSDEDAATLSTYITAYETAVDAEKAAASSDTEDLSSYHTAVKEAVEALLTAAKEADIKLGLTLNSEQKSSDTNSENKKQNGTSPEQGIEQKAKSIDSAIASLSDEDAATLSTYITAYKTAVDAEKAAASSDTEDLSSYRAAVKKAVKALFEAAKSANIAFGSTASNTAA